MKRFYTAVTLGALFCLGACSGGSEPAGGTTSKTSPTTENATTEKTDTVVAFTPEILPIPEIPEGFEPMPIPEDNALTPEKVALGRQLFFDKRLSADGSVACYSCHVCEKGLTDGKSKAVGALGKEQTRSSPSLWNVGYHTNWYWDGRSATMEKQAMAAWTGGNMGAKPKLEEIVNTVNGLEGYKAQFQKVFSADASPDNIVQAITSFERAVLVCAGTPFDKWQGGDKAAISEEAVRGWEVFRGKAACGTCHAGSLFTDLQFHNVGIGMDAKEPDVGRFKVSSDKKDTGAFKTPTLRDISQSAPYFHDGSVATLEEAVDLMVDGGKKNPHLDEKLKKVKLTAEEKADLIAFLKSLDCPCELPQPKLPGL